MLFRAKTRWIPRISNRECEDTTDEALASEPDMSSIAHSVVLVKAKSASDIDALKKEISENLNPNKWICVGVEEIKMASHDNILLVVMDDEVGDKMIENFNNLSK